MLMKPNYTFAQLKEENKREYKRLVKIVFDITRQYYVEQPQYVPKNMPLEMYFETILSLIDKGFVKIILCEETDSLGFLMFNPKTMQYEYAFAFQTDLKKYFS